MTTRGLLRGLPGVTRYTPRLVIAGTPDVWPASLGDNQWGAAPHLVGAFARGEYVVAEGMCFGHAEIGWGSNASALPAGNLEITLPVVPFCEDVNVTNGDFFLGSAMIGRLIGTGDGPMSAYLTPNLRAGFVVGPWTLSGTATVASGTSSLVVAHGFGAAPIVTVTPQANISTVGGNPATAGIWVDTVGATNFTLHVGSTNLTSSLAVGWVAALQSNILSTTSPYALGSNGDHLEFTFSYPVAP